MQSTTPTIISFDCKNWKSYHGCWGTRSYFLLDNHTGGVAVSVLASSVVDHGFEPRSGQTKDYKIGICCFSAKHAALRRTDTDWLARNQNNVSE